MAIEYDLTQLDSHTFEHLVNFLAMSVLGDGVTGFAEGPDGGRDGYLIGKSAYPTKKDAWNGVWYIQSKFHKPHLSKDPQKWLLDEIKKELKEFEIGSRTILPDNWIIATNIQPTGLPQTGSYDKIKKLVCDFNPKIKVDVWGGRKILDFLARNEAASRYYGHFLTPGHIISKLYDQVNKKDAEVKKVINHLIVNQFSDLCYTKLEQAGSIGDQRPKLYDLFTDLPIASNDNGDVYNILECLVSASNNVQTIEAWNNYGKGWRDWSLNPKRARVILLKGGPGQGKSTVGQYFAQIQRAAFILSENGPTVANQFRENAEELKQRASQYDFWPQAPRIPLFVELKDYATWYTGKNEYESRNIIEYVCQKIRNKTSKKVNEEIFCEALLSGSWFVNFDGLDEVPNDIKDEVAKEVIVFANEQVAELNADVLVLCTTRPQGYSGQFDELYSSVVTLQPLSSEKAIQCATPVIAFARGEEEAEKSISILRSAMTSPQVREIMTTPLQSHIMAVLVRDGGRPPEKRWELFNNFYSVMKKRESLKNFPDPRILILLREKDQLLKSVHDRLGICLHSKAEKGGGAQAALNREEFKLLVRKAASLSEEGDIEPIVNTLMEATTERLVFVNTPDSNTSVRFDIRQLQEFFAAEFIYNAVSIAELKNRLTIIAGDSHWREVVHFVISSLALSMRSSEITIAVEVLQLLDEDDDNYKIRAFKKRLGVGSLLVLRLFQEGVLESDKRIRQPFLKVLGNLWNIPEYDVILQIINLKKENAKSSFLKSMTDAFLELDFSEHFSIGALLAFLMDDNNPRLKEVTNKLEIAPPYYLVTTLSLVNTFITHDKENQVCKGWFFTFVINLLFSKSMQDLILQEATMHFIRSNMEYIMEELSSLNIKKDEMDIFKLFFISLADDIYEDRTASNESKKRTKNYCFVEVGYYEDVLTNSDLEEIAQVNSIFEPLSTLSLCFNSLLSYLKDKNIQTLENLLLAIKNNNFSCRFLPPVVVGTIPVDFHTHDIKLEFEALLGQLKLVKDTSCKDIPITFKDNMSIRYFKFNEEEYSDDSWSSLCKEEPNVAAGLIEELYSRYSHFDKFDEALKNNLFKSFDFNDLKTVEPMLTLFNLIGLFFAISPSHELPIRALLNSKPSLDLRNAFTSESHHPFPISIDNEKNILITFAHSLFLCNLFNKYTRKRFVHIIKKDYDGDFLAGYGLNSDILLTNAFDSSQSNTFRSSCLSIYLGQREVIDQEGHDAFFELNLDKLLLELVSPETERLLSCSLYCYLMAKKEYGLRLMEFIGDYSLLTRESFYTRTVLQNVYQRLRERSLAPVNQADVLNDWLEYSFL